MTDEKSDTDENKSRKRLKEIDKGKSFFATKVQETVEWYTCGALHVIYSYHAVGEKKISTKKKLEYLLNSLENRYVCVNSINNNAGLYVKIQLRCGNYIGSQY